MRFFYYFTPFGVLVLIIHDSILKNQELFEINLFFVKIGQQMLSYFV